MPDLAPLLSADAARYPDPMNSATGPLYGRGVWELGEDGGDGIVVQGHDRRAWAALNRYCRELGISRPSRFLGGPAPAVAQRWVTFRTSCGCSPSDHVEHRQEAIACDFDLHDVCSEGGTNDDCGALPPCGEQYAWMFTRHDPDTEAVPDTAAPVLVWD